MFQRWVPGILGTFGGGGSSGPGSEILLPNKHSILFLPACRLPIRLLLLLLPILTVCTCFSISPMKFACWFKIFRFEPQNQLFKSKVWKVETRKVHTY